MKTEFNFVAKGPEQCAEKLVILLHGYGTNGTFMEKMADEILARLPEARVIMPHAPDVLERPPQDEKNPLKVPDFLSRDDFTLPPEEQRQWFSIKAESAAAYHDRALAAGRRLNDFIDGQRDKLKLKDKDIAIMGFSQGGLVALYTAFARAAGVGCVVGHSAPFIKEDGLVSKSPALYIYGAEDEEISQSRYDMYLKTLQNYVDDVEIKKLSSLRLHKTSFESRRLSAAYIERRLKR